MKIAYYRENECDQTYGNDRVLASQETNGSLSTTDMKLSTRVASKFKLFLHKCESQGLYFVPKSSWFGHG